MNPTPHQILKALLQGITPPTPLFLPIVFSLGAKIENLSPRAYLSNPTKITNAVRQIRARLRSDGIACYFDPHLEAEALGATLEWSEDNQAATPHWPQTLRSPEEAAKHPRVSVAAEVIQRLKSLLREEPLLLAGVSGPLTLAAQITRQTGREPLHHDDPADVAVELAAATITQIATKLVEAGANVIFIREEILPALTPQTAEAWAAALAPAINIIRFYEALPVLQITNAQAFAENSSAIFQQKWDCTVCPTLPSPPNATFLHSPGHNAPPVGIALPAAFQSDESSAQNFRQSLHTIISGVHPVLITTATDDPAATDVKQLSRLWEDIHR